MKNVEKLVPVAVAGLVLASAGTVDARAEDTTPAVDTNPKITEEQKQETTGSSTEIKSATKEEVPNPDGSVDSLINVSTSADGTVTDEGEVTTQTEVTKTESETTTGTPTSTTTTNSDGSTTTTTTTPTETTTTEESKTEIDGTITPPEDNTPPTDTEKKEVLDDLKDEVKDGWTLDQVTVKDEEAGTEATKLGDFTAVGKETANKAPYLDLDGNTITEETTTVTFVRNPETTTESKPLTMDELGVLLGAELTKTGENTYTYTKDGADVTVTVTNGTAEGDNIESTTTTYRVTLSQTKTTTHYAPSSDSSEVKDEELKDVVETVTTDTEAGKEKVEAILAKLSADEIAKLKSDMSAEYKEGSKTYTLTYEEKVTEAPSLEGLSNEDIFGMLKNTDGAYKLVDVTDGEGNVVGKKIVKTVGEVDYDLTLADAQEALTKKEIKVTMKVVDAHGGQNQVGPTQDEKNQMASDVMSQAASNALVAALEAAEARDYKLEGDPVFDEVKNTWHVIVKAMVDGVEKTFTYDIQGVRKADGITHWTTAKAGIDGEYVEGSGSTTKVEGDAHVFGETVVWTQTTTPGGLTVTDGKVTAGQDFFDKLYGEGKTVKSVTLNDDGNTVVVVEDADGKTHTYTYTFQAPKAVGSWDSLSADEKAELLKGTSDSSVTKLDDLKRISWTVTETVPTSTTTETKVEIIEGGAPSADGNSYTFKDGNTDITIDLTGGNRTFTSADGKTTYTLEIAEGQVPTISAEDLKDAAKREAYSQKIADILGSKYSKVVVGEDGKITATYTNAGKVTNDVAVTITEGSYKIYTVTKTEITNGKSSTATGSASATWKDGATEAEIKAAQEAAKRSAFNKLIADIVEVIKNAGDDVDVYYGDHKLSLTADGNGIAYGDDLESLTPIIYGGAPEWFNIQNAINFAEIGRDDLRDFLEDARKDAEENGRVSEMGHLHLELLVGNSLKTEAHPEGEDCAILGDGLQVWVGKDVDAILGSDEETEKKHQASLSSTMDYDPQGFYQYKRTEEEALKDNSDREDGTKDPTKAETSEYKFYKIVGQVAHNVVTGTVKVDKEKWWQSDTITIDSDGVIQGDFMGEGGWNKAQRVLKSIKKEYKDAQLVAFTKDNQTFYKVYKEVATLEAYGYLDDANNECGWSYKNDRGQTVKNARGFDLKLSNLTLVNGKVTASGANTYSYSANLTTRSSKTDVLNGAGGHKLSATNTVTTHGTEEQERDGGSRLSGSYEITESRGEEKLKEEDGSWKHAGSSSDTYDTYQTWKDETQTSEAEGVRYEGSLGFTYQKEDEVEYTDLDDVFDNALADENGVTRTVNRTRNVAATLETTTVTTTQGSTTTTTRTPAPYVPPVITPTYDDDDDDDPTPPPAVIDEEDVPLAETPETPDVEIPDEEVPMAEEPDVEIPDEEVPLAEVPQTGDNFLLEALALAISSASGLWLGLGKKRRS